MVVVTIVINEAVMVVAVVVYSGSGGTWWLWLMSWASAGSVGNSGNHITM